MDTPEKDTRLARYKQAILDALYVIKHYKYTLPVEAWETIEKILRNAQRNPRKK